MILSVIGHFAEKFVILGSEFCKCLYCIIVLAQGLVLQVFKFKHLDENYYIDMDQLFSCVTMILKA